MSREERQQQARESTRRAILDAALDLFIADGYTQVSIRNIAAKVEYSPAAIYSYFPSKDEIFFALAEEGFRQIGGSQVSDTPSADPLDDVRATLWRLSEFSKEQPQYFALVFLDRHVPRVGREYRALLDHFRDPEPRAVAGRALHRRRRVPGDDARRGRTSIAVCADPRHRRAARVEPDHARGRRRARSRCDRDDDRWHSSRRAAPRAAFGLAQCSRLNAQCSTSRLRDRWRSS